MEQFAEVVYSALSASLLQVMLLFPLIKVQKLRLRWYKDPVVNNKPWRQHHITIYNKEQEHFGSSFKCEHQDLDTS